MAYAVAESIRYTLGPKEVGEAFPWRKVKDETKAIRHRTEGVRKKLEEMTAN